MLSVVKSYLQVKLNLSERGAEMVEYAIVLACIAAVGVAFYSTSGDGGTASNGLEKILSKLWDKVATNAKVSTGGSGNPGGQ